MNKILAILALLAALSTGVTMAETTVDTADEGVDCFFEANASHPSCQENTAGSDSSDPAST